MTPYTCIKPQCHPQKCSDCNCAISPTDDAAHIILELLNTFAVCGHGHPFEDGDSAIVDKARSWLQAARRAPAVPTDRLRVNPASELVAKYVYGDKEALADIVALSLSLENANDMLAAAHQPPDAGCSVSNAETLEESMQLPDPELFAINTAPYGSETKRYEEVAKEFRNDHDVVCFYTEQQVRQLLANHA